MRFKPFNLAPDKAFLVIAILFGLAYLAITPPFMVPDEREHFYRAYSISQGQLSGGTTLLPRSVVDFAEPSRSIPGFPDRKISLRATLAAWNTPLLPGQLATADFPGASVYSPLVYLPHVVGILLGRLLQLSPLLMWALR